MVESLVNVNEVTVIVLLNLFLVLKKKKSNAIISTCIVFKKATHKNICGYLAVIHQLTVG